MNEIGVFIQYKADGSLGEKLRHAKNIGASCCQLAVWDTALYTEENARIINESVERHGFRISALWAGWSGECEWNFTRGPETIGLVPKKYREMRKGELLTASNFAELIGVRQIITHVGFLPDDANSEEYKGTLSALRDIASAFKKKGQLFLFETGQEKPETLLRAIRDIGGDNVGINLDTANLILYGMASTLEAVEALGGYVMNTHIKDGLYPSEPGELGKQVKAGEGEADIPRVVKRLRTLGYSGPLTIEREIEGEEQLKDISDTYEYLKKILVKI